MKRQRFFEGLGLKVYVTLAICMALLLNVQFLNAQSSTINVKGGVNDAMGAGFVHRCAASMRSSARRIVPSRFTEWIPCLGRDAEFA